MGTERGAEPLIAPGTGAVQVRKLAVVWQTVWSAPAKPESGVSVRVAAAVTPGAALMEAGFNAAENGGVTIRGCGAEAEAPNTPLGA